MTDEKKPELKVRDALRMGKVGARDVPFMRATSVLFDRIFRRPAGNSARIWKRVEWDDPFEDKPYRSRKVDYKGVYAKGRFVRIDKAQAEAKPTPKHDPHADLVERLKKAKAREEEEARAKKAAEAKAKKDAAAAPAPPKEQPSAPVIPLPTKKEMEPTPPIDRRPPMPTLTPKARRSGRMSTRSQSQRPGRRRPVLSTVPPDGLTLEERRPPMPQPKEAPSVPAPVDADLPKPTPTQATPPAPLPTPTRPPENTPAVSDPPKTTKPDTPINRSPMGSTSSAGMDDLFNMGGGQGRLRIRKKKTEEPTEPPADSDDSST